MTAPRYTAAPPRYTERDCRLELDRIDRQRTPRWLTLLLVAAWLAGSVAMASLTLDVLARNDYPAPCFDGQDDADLEPVPCEDRSPCGDC